MEIEEGVMRKRKEEKKEKSALENCLARGDMTSSSKLRRTLKISGREPSLGMDNMGGTNRLRMGPARESVVGMDWARTAPGGK